MSNENVDKVSFEKTDREVVYKGGTEFRAAGRVYSLAAIPLADLISGDYDEMFLAMPHDRSEPGRNQFVNLTNADRRNRINEMLQKYLRFQGEPMSLEKSADHEWTMDDIGRFLLDTMNLSG